MDKYIPIHAGECITDPHGDYYLVTDIDNHIIALRKDLERARDALRDIRERTEHSGSWQRMLDSITLILDKYWKERNIG
jgi:hypothetical protein